jgi:hypothetical protein
MSVNDRARLDGSDEPESLSMDDLNPQDLSSEAADQVRGGLSGPSIPATPPGVPIPYPNIAGGASAKS